MSIPPSRAQSEVFSTSQYGTQPTRTSRQINHFILPTFILSVVGLACLWALWYYMRLTDKCIRQGSMTPGDRQYRRID
ncbi:hypothetical protein Tcan_06645 [Toxocara canis]|uniref:Uncharacterized protein n=1 Tax=Toxocara canis TaxID=6265 RepID=A0A0B2W4Q2_TOXCA|nr:hypothetical protein Tcan_06645 [Toxocara canis]